MSEFYTLKQATELAELPNGILRVWRSRHPEIAKNPTLLNLRRRGPGITARAKLNLVEVIYIAIIGRLKQSKMLPPDAARCADRFLQLIRSHEGNIHETFKSKWLLVVDHDAKHIEPRVLAGTAAVIDPKHFPARAKIILNLNAMYEEALTLVAVNDL